MRPASLLRLAGSEERRGQVGGGGRLSPESESPPPLAAPRAPACGCGLRGGRCARPRGHARRGGGRGPDAQGEACAGVPPGPPCFRLPLYGLELQAVVSPPAAPGSVCAELHLWLFALSSLLGWSRPLPASRALSNLAAKCSRWARLKPESRAWAPLLKKGIVPLPAFVLRGACWEAREGPSPLQAWWGWATL